VVEQLTLLLHILRVRGMYLSPKTSDVAEMFCPAVQMWDKQDMIAFLQSFSIQHS
jgi:hypothetical protein